MNFRKPFKTLFWVTVFSIAMAYLESSVVLYLRLVYYPEGFQFPLKELPIDIFLIEIGREFSTIVMLLMIAHFAGEKLLRKFFFFIFAFGIWDIFYYIWLKIFIDWPATILENDILFLIPVPWVGPVLAPVIISLTMIAVAVLSLIIQEYGLILKADKIHILLSLAGVVVVFISFILGTFSTNLLQDHNPVFSWPIFIIGEIILILAFILFIRTNTKQARG